MNIVLLIFGGLSSGKTSFVDQLQGKKWTENTVPTNKVKHTTFRKSDLVIDSYEFSGQRRYTRYWFEQLQKQMLDNTIIAYLVDYSEYRVMQNHRMLAENFQYYKQLLHRVILQTGNTPILIIGNKTDLSDFKHDNSGSSAKSLFSAHDGLDELVTDLGLVVRENHSLTLIMDHECQELKQLYKQMHIEDKNEILMNRDFGIFLTSMNTQEGLSDIMDWIFKEFKKEMSQ